MSFPWVSGKRLRYLGADVRLQAVSISKGKRAPGDDLPLASAVHGPGILCALVLALTGALGHYTTWGKSMMGHHELFVAPMWVYLIGHVDVAVLHELSGERLLWRMSQLW